MCSKVVSNYNIGFFLYQFSRTKYAYKDQLSKITPVDMGDDDVKQPPPTRRPNRMQRYAPYLRTYSQEERAYFKGLTIGQQDKFMSMEAKISTRNNTTTPLRFRVLSSNMPPHIKALAIQKLRLLGDRGASSEATKIVRWIESLCQVPFGIYTGLPVNALSPRTEVQAFIQTIQTNLDSKVFGHTDAKSQVLRLLCQWISNPVSKGLVMGIQGPMGCGKTTLIKEGICSVLGLPFSFIPLGGASGSEFLDGHSFTYEGATWGKTVASLMNCKTMNPVLFFDELDKVSESHRGEEVINYLIHLTDAAQNDKVMDKYFAELDFDLSRCIIIFSYNDESRVSPILRDRMACIRTSGYTENDKVLLAKDYLMPSVLKEFARDPNSFTLDESIVRLIIGRIATEDGVRNLRRALQDLVGHLNMKMLMEGLTIPHKVSVEDVKRFVAKAQDKDSSFPLMMYS